MLVGSLVSFICLTNGKLAFELRSWEPWFGAGTNCVLLILCLMTELASVIQPKRMKSIIHSEYLELEDIKLSKPDMETRCPRVHSHKVET